MNICLRNVRESDWRLLKSEASKRKVTLSNMLHEMISAYNRGEKTGNWNRIISREGLLTSKDEQEMKESVLTFRKDFRFRNG